MQYLTRPAQSSTRDRWNSDGHRFNIDNFPDLDSTNFSQNFQILVSSYF